ncbi:YkvA family protein [Thermotoga profunda]|uniref:YkvA family protein n=1 Tax=Thermotoga profunda TaxID=1508420 RepID=UPI000597E3FE|nr:YkvA family protein [Thermotoga profunda]
MLGIFSRVSKYITEKRALGMRNFGIFLKQVATKEITLPLWAFLLLLLACMYVLSPLDSIPDFLPIIGFLDDALLAISTLNTIKPFARVKNGTKQQIVE